MIKNNIYFNIIHSETIFIIEMKLLEKLIYIYIFIIKKKKKKIKKWN